jgi:short-subunit dehydrogenase
VDVLVANAGHGLGGAWSIKARATGATSSTYGSKAFIDSLAAAINEEIRGSGVTVTRPKPGATKLEFFARAHMQGTEIGQLKKDDPADVAKTGWEAMMEGEATVIHGFKNKLQVAAADVMTDAMTAKVYCSEVEPGSASD